MSMEECFRTLDLPPGASAEEVRRAYLDQARVWHPDRFESDQRLRGVAEEHLRKVNEAYEGLKGKHDYSAGAPPVPVPDPQAAAPAFDWRPILRSAGPIALCLAPIILAVMIAVQLHVAALATRVVRPRVLEPMAAIDYMSDPHVAVDTLNDWARGDVINLWSSAAKPIVLSPASAPISVPDRPPRNRSASAMPAADPTIANGTELITLEQHSGAGELRAVNTTSLEAIVFLVRGERSAIRAIYVSPNAEASLQSIPPGVYSVHVELGKGIDPKRLQFQRANRTLQRFGPFEFWEARSADKSWNRHYEIKLAEP